MVLYGIYQIGFTKAYATNESSYRWGYSQAVKQHVCEVTQKNECMNDVSMDDVCEHADAPANTNETACDHGWNHAWDHIEAMKR